jgi:PAS domain-containing protein
MRLFTCKWVYIVMINYSSQTISQANATGILVVDSNRRIVSINRKVIEMWGFPKHLVDSHDEKLALEFASFQLKNPKSFLKKVQKIYINMELEIHDTIKLKDGRIFERHSKPQWLEDEVVARIWIFREITGWNIEPELSII